MRSKVLCAILIISVGRCAASGAGPPQESRIEAATVSAVVAGVTVQHEGEVRPSPLRPHETVSAGDVVRTKKKASAEISFPSGSILDMAPRSELKFVRLDVHFNQTAIQLIAGKLHIKVGKLIHPSFTFQVLTPTALIAVLGTEFIVELRNGKGKRNVETRVQCIEGYVTVRGTGGEVELHAGESTTVPRGMPPAVPTRVSPGRTQTQISSPHPLPGGSSTRSEAPSAGPRAGEVKPTGDRIYSVGGGVSPPIPVYIPQPEYSEEARKAKLQGSAVLLIVVDELGNVTDCKVVKPLGMGLDERAVETAKTWKFKPALKNGQPVSVRLTVERSFRL